jgi:hypothetical protein
VPNSMDDCVRLVQERTEALARVWCEGGLAVSSDMLVRAAHGLLRPCLSLSHGRWERWQDWRRRFGRLQRGQLLLYDEEVRMLCAPSLSVSVHWCGRTMLMRLCARGVGSVHDRATRRQEPRWPPRDFFHEQGGV